MRTGEARRATKETAISVQLCLDGGAVDIRTGIGFFDHMLEAFAVHGGFGLTVQAEGDLHVDGHHTVEDTGKAVKGKQLDIYFDTHEEAVLYGRKNRYVYLEE